MTARLEAYLGTRIFDGTVSHVDTALIVRGGDVEALVPLADIPGGATRIDLVPGTVAPGYVDLQVNGGGGVMFNDDPSVDTLAIIAGAHAKLGTTSLLPTLITDTPEVTRAAVAAAAAAIEDGVPGIAGLHLEGPHLTLARKGAHDPALIRPMEEPDLRFLLDAAAALPALMVTVAPESVTEAQIHTLSAAGIVVSLGHTDCSFDAAAAAAEAGASCVTHIFNAMSPFGNREPGLVGAALGLGGLSAGLIADFIHAHPQSVTLALAAKHGPGRIFLVTDAMATAGSEIDSFTLNGRTITRRDGRLTLADGTLAGADLDLTSAVCNIASLGIPLDTALAMATSIPAGIAGCPPGCGTLTPRHPASFIHLDERQALTGVWRNGKRLR